MAASKSNFFCAPPATRRFLKSGVLIDPLQKPKPTTLGRSHFAQTPECYVTHPKNRVKLGTKRGQNGPTDFGLCLVAPVKGQ